MVFSRHRVRAGLAREFDAARLLLAAHSCHTIDSDIKCVVVKLGTSLRQTRWSLLS